ncbi:SLC13 family permease [Xanthobacter tagetidis]|nr:SLC13 family permease [Xanthobacter tagetidis]MBB6309801.1 di/tricarboxylate transporter [Xanthobacter tagetidis]
MSRGTLVSPAMLAGLICALGLAGVLAGRFDTTHQLGVLLVCGTTMALFATRALPEYLSALMFFVACIVGGIAPATTVLSGFAGSAVWLVIAGAVMGAALRHTGLAKRLGEALAGRRPMSFPLFLARVVLFGAGLVFLMPSAMGRILLVMPMLEATVAAAGLEARDRRAGAIVLAGMVGTFFPAMAVLPANVPNNVLAGLLETTGIGAPSFAGYLALHYPVLGLAKLALIIAMLAFTYRREPAMPGRQAAPRRLPFAAGEIRLLVVLTITILAWLSDAWHHVSPAWVGMAAAVVCLWPSAGLMPEKGLGAVNLDPIFYVAAVVGVGAVLEASGIGHELAALTGRLVAWGGSDPAVTVLILMAIATALGLLVTIVAVPAILTPIAPGVAAMTGLPVETVAMTQVVGFSTVFLPYQAPPLAVAMQVNPGIGRLLVGFCFRLAILSVFIIWPLNLLWWRVIGWLP